MSKKFKADWQKIDINTIKPNPKNPRIVRDKKFQALVKSLKEFPEMLEIRPIVIDEKMMIIGGEQRYRAAKAAKIKVVPVVKASNLTPSKKKEFLVKDNAHAGDWDKKGLGEMFDNSKLEDWGIDISLSEPKQKYTDENAQMPIVPEFDEKHKAIIIVVDTEMEYANALTILGLGKAKDRINRAKQCQVIKFSDFLKVIKK